MLSYRQYGVYMNGGELPMMNYVQPELEIVEFENEDVITASNPLEDIGYGGYED